MGLWDSPTGRAALLYAKSAGMMSAILTDRSTIVTNSDRGGMSIFEAAGGQEAFLRLAAAHHQRCLDDPVLNHPFSHPGHPRHLERLAAYWAEVFGGPPTYTHEAGGHSFMLDLHARTQAEEDLGTRFSAVSLTRWTTPNCRPIMTCAPRSRPIWSGRSRML